jgi:lipopolysaccharide biosynthesis protein
MGTNLYFSSKKKLRDEYLAQIDSFSALVLAGQTSVCQRKTIAVAHVHFPELWKEMRSSIRSINPDEIIVTTTKKSDFTDLVRADFPDATILELQNQGRDIWPLITLAQKGYFHEKSIVFKIHSKKSKHLLNGNRWRKDLLQAISRSNKVTSAIKYLLEFGNYSLIGHDKYLRNMDQRRISANTEYISWSVKNDLLLDAENVSYIDGTIFACKSEVLSDLAQLNLTSDNFVIEPSNNVPFSKTFAIKMYLYERFSYFQSLKVRRREMDLNTRPASPETYALEGYLGFLAKKHGKSSGVMTALRDFSESRNE